MLFRNKMFHDRHLIDFVCLCNLSMRAIEKTFQLSFTVSQPNNRKKTTPENFYLKQRVAQNFKTKLIYYKPVISSNITGRYFLNQMPL